MKFVFVILLVLSTNLFSWVTATPTIKSNNDILNDKNYLWLKRNKDINLVILMGGESKKFFTETSLIRYIKLKMRSFVHKLNIEKKINIKDHAKMVLEIELYPYNDKLGIYYGLISYALQPSVYLKSNNRKDYKITMAIAGNKFQIVDLVKVNIDSIIEKFSEDYYYIEDLEKKH